ncbi:hypothetical protein ACQ4PT_017944 [Festuca glaucescens]
MAATADPRAKPSAAHHLEPWARQQQQPPRAHRVRVPAHQTVEESSSVGASASRDRRRSSSHSGRRSTGGGGTEDLRGKLMGHLRDAADRVRAVPQPSPPLPLPPPPLSKPASPQPPETESPEQVLKPPQADVAEKPWKLRERTRRRPAALTSWPASAPSPSSSRRRKRAPFSVTLAHEEIEEDIYALTGGRPRRRPRKRPRAVQQKLDSLFPGMWLAEVTADDYKVPEPEEE